jgi:hypothetical protein
MINPRLRSMSFRALLVPLEGLSKVALQEIILIGVMPKITVWMTIWKAL